MSDPHIARLLDEASLRRCAELYAQGADRRDPGLWAAVVTEDCVIEGPGFRLEGRTNIVSGLDVLSTMYVATQHRVHNQVLTIDGDRARGETYGTADHVTRDDTGTTLLSWAIRYQDRWRRDNGQWRFTNRVLVIDWTETRSI